jgi:hypothetical protein
MTTEDIIIQIFIEVDEQLPAISKHPQAKLYPSELVTIGILFALKVVSFRAFYRWLKRDYQTLFALPERSRLLRLLRTHQAWCKHLLASPSFFSVLDSYPIELIFPCREGRSQQQIGKKGRDKGRWSIAIKLCWLLNDEGKVIAWDWAGMNVYDKHFHPLIEPFEGQTIVLADLGFRDSYGVPQHLKLCAKGTWNERMVVETALSMVTMLCNLKHLPHRLGAYITTRLAFLAAMFNVLLSLFHRLHPEADRFQMSFAEFSL